MTKKLLAALLVLALLAGACSAAMASGDSMLLEWNEFSVEWLRTSPTTYANGDVDITFYCRFINGTRHTMWLKVSDVTVDGVPVDGVGKTNIAPGTDSGADSGDYIFIKPLADSRSAGVNALCNARSVAMTLTLKDNDTYEEYCSQRVTLSLTNVPSFTPRAGGTTPRPSYGGTSYRALVKGDSGEAVRRMQQRLIDLGYLYDSADGKFGSKTAEAVREFSGANGLGASEIATPEMQEKLFSSSAKAVQEPWVPLTIRDGANGTWMKLKGDKIKFRVQVTNVSRNRTVKAFEIYMYAVDVWGDRIYGSDTVYYGTTTKKVAPGKTVYCDYFVMPNRSRINKVYVGVKKVVFTDGTIRENSSVDYTSWTLS